MSEINGLSEREIEILKLVATGASNKEIASKLFISANTVKVHLRNIFAKIGVESRTEAAMYVVNSGLLSDHASTSEAIPAQRLIDKGSGDQELEKDLAVPGFDANQPHARRSATLRRLRFLAILSFFILGLVTIWFMGYRFPGVLRPENTITNLEGNRWVFAPEISISRSGLAVAAFNNFVFAISGESEAGVSNLVERFDTNELTWEQVKEKPTPTTDISAVVIGGKIFVPGGRLADGSVTNVMEIYDPRQDRWMQGVPMPVGLSAYALTAFEGKLYLFGGWDGEKYIANVYEYDPSTGQWSSKAKMSTPRGFSGAATIGGNIYVIGGFDGKRNLDLVEAYSPNLDDGSGTPWSRKTSLPNERSGIGVIGIADYLYVLGRDEESGRSTALIYTPQLNQWSEFETPIESPWSHMGVVALGNQFYAIGGLIDGEPASQNLAYQAIFTILLPVIR